MLMFTLFNDSSLSEEGAIFLPIRSARRSSQYHLNDIERISSSPLIHCLKG